MLVLGFILIGLGVFIVCLTVIDGIRETKEHSFGGFKRFYYYCAGAYYRNNQ